MAASLRLQGKYTVPRRFLCCWQDAAGRDALDYTAVCCLFHLRLRQRRHLCVLQVRTPCRVAFSAVGKDAAGRDVKGIPLFVA
jgi:hypothetical protein